MHIDEKDIFYGVVGFMLVEFVWEFYLNLRQYQVQKKNTEIPTELIGILSRETFDKARLYAIDKTIFRLVKQTIMIVFAVGFLLCNGIYLVWELSGRYMESFGYQANENNEILQSAVFLIIINLIDTIIGLPIAIYHTFVLEELYDFNKQTMPFFIKDKLKIFILQQVLQLPICSGIIYIIKVGGDYFFLYLWFFIIFVSLFVYTIYPDFIAPIFDKYTPLPAGELRTEIENFVKGLNFPLSDLYVVDGSKRSAHSNAYFYGFFKKKRIVLFDTLLKDFLPEDADKKDQSDQEKEKSEKKGCDTYEILAVLAHEVGHWKFSHNLKNLCIAQLNFLFVLIIFSKLFRYPALYRAFGFYNSTPVLIGFKLVLFYGLSPYFLCVKYLMGILGRRFEFQADKFARAQGFGNYLMKALIKLISDNLDFPIYDPMFSNWYNSHPPLLERLQALEKDE